ncbi:CRISPR-associated helicase Cas3, subtype I-F/YPEST [Serratia ficaria]|uniref:type I-F CRISPR-associated helicase Cas3f n=1 Tax=Serratia ficaria TaxID=61651 RepID=UPI002179BFCD|nr:type I-F CRISPR-associated helicase Cas3f [Serratia ficaria]CAI1791339.1 CRISPR-associated helicase Cas3, subtype I-F/YPEST [Serratia ficaria]
MNILLISQCNKFSLVQTRKILDQFAERKGERCWQTAITLQGLDTLRRVLRKTARRNTAVACHWIRGANQTELLWVVGNPRRFNAQGTVPTNSTTRDILKSQDENTWHSAESISLMAGIAGLFHDFGKSNALFQAGLAGGNKRFQPYRHEWVSLRLFQAFVGQQSDEQWLAVLATVASQDEEIMLQRLYQDMPGKSDSPFSTLPPLAQAIGWLIVAHHRLPVYPRSDASEHYQSPPDFSDSARWLEKQFNAVWNSTNQDHDDWLPEEFTRVWQFPQGTPLQSPLWRAKAQKLAKRAQQQGSLTQFGRLEQHFAVHLARLILMLADHVYSAGPAVEKWQATGYAVWANTDRQTGKYKQKLDEHNIGVGQNAVLLGRLLPNLRATLPAITRHKDFKRRATKEQYRWQDKAYDVAASLRQRSFKQGFFGVNMASTGCGKTFANARIMYALADEQIGCRFSIALGLRTLTLQTGDALRDRLHLQDDDLAVLIGSAAVQQLHKTPAPDIGSVSAEALFAEHQYVRYDGSLDDGRLSRWLAQDARLHKLISAPVLVSTIDYLMPATEGVRGGRQIAPMLRLLTADLVLDEPDDFDIADLPALCRLVNWAGMMGSRVLLSSATLPPALVQALFNAYCTGRRAYQRSCAEPGVPLNVCCAWFDEYGAISEDIDKAPIFLAAHTRFVGQRIGKLEQLTPLRRAELLPVVVASRQKEAVLDAVSTCLHSSITGLHHQHHQQHSSGKTVSVGLIRMANINPLVAVAQRLMQLSPPADCRIHYCVYHSQHPLAMRSHIERRLDSALTRHQPEAIWDVDEIKQALCRFPELHHIFVVLASPVAEVGRDWDLDWAIAEPSSMRSLIQLAGRVQRHRKQAPKNANLLILNKNIKALCESSGESLAYCRPGFEAQDFRLSSHDLQELLLPQQYQHISAIPRIRERAQSTDYGPPFNNLVDLEHHRLWETLLGTQKNSNSAALWWRFPLSWNAEMQRRYPFRKSAQDMQYYLYLEEDEGALAFVNRDPGVSGTKESGDFNYPEFAVSAGNSLWMDIDYPRLYATLAEALGMEFREISERFGEINLRKFTEDETEVWNFHPALGVYRALV